MFSYTSDISLHEYIRRRRLSEAAYELQPLQAKVIDVAIKYGYESSDAFCVAFKKQHGVTPAMAKRKNTSLNSYPRLQFRMNIIGGTAMKYRVVQKDSVNVIGEFIPSNNYKQNPDLPTVEKYFSNETEAADYKVEIWIPVM